jgi:putative transposase
MTKLSKESVQPKKRNRPTTSTNPTTGGFEISDELWATLAPLLPPYINTHRFGGGRPRVPDRKCANGVFYVLRTGCQWKALDQTGICSGSTAHLRFQEWVESGVFLDLWRVGLEKYDELKGIDWSWLSMDGAITKAPLGGEKNRQKSNRPRQIGRQTQSVDGSQRHPYRLGRRRGQPE